MMFMWGAGGLVILLMMLVFWGRDRLVAGDERWLGPVPG